jgi:hypothetical protein
MSENQRGASIIGPTGSGTGGGDPHQNAQADQGADPDAVEVWWVKPTRRGTSDLIARLPVRQLVVTENGEAAAACSAT